MYHEYTDGSRRHYNGIRLTPAVDMSIYDDPNSAWWKAEAEAAMRKFDQLPISEAGWMQFQSYVPNKMTWKRAYQIYSTAIEHYADGVTPEALAHFAGILPE